MRRDYLDPLEGGPVYVLLAKSVFRVLRRRQSSRGVMVILIVCFIVTLYNKTFNMILLEPNHKTTAVGWGWGWGSKTIRCRTEVCFTKMAREETIQHHTTYITYTV